MHVSPPPTLHTPIARPSNGIGYIVVVGEGTTAPWYTQLMEEGKLDTDDPPPICVAPSIGRFEVREDTVHESRGWLPVYIAASYLSNVQCSTRDRSVTLKKACKRWTCEEKSYLTGYKGFFFLL